MNKRILTFCITALFSVTAFGCSEKKTPAKTETGETVPAFKLAYSEYISWAVFAAAHDQGLFDGREGKLGTLEKKRNVDIVLVKGDYVPTLDMYSGGQVDAVTMTNVDSLAPSLQRASVAVLPTSTSAGADVLIVPSSVTDVKQLQGKKVYGEERSVSEYMFRRNLVLKGEDASKYNFSHQAIDVATLAIKQDNVDIVAVWNPFGLDILKNRGSAVHVLMDSSTIPEEIIDMLVVAEASLNKEGGDRFVMALAEAYYTIAKQVKEGPMKRDTRISMLTDFAKGQNMNPEGDMDRMLEQTRFYGTPAAGAGLFESARLKDRMKTVVDLWVSVGYVKSAPTIGYGSATGSNLRFDPAYMKAVASGN